MKNNRLTYYDIVNQAETTNQLCDAIDEIALEYDNYIPGRSQEWPAKHQKMAVKRYITMNRDNRIPPNIITREFGLRAQAMYLKYYHEEALKKKFKEQCSILDNPCGEIPLKEN